MLVGNQSHSSKLCNVVGELVIRASEKHKIFRNIIFLGNVINHSGGKFAVDQQLGMLSEVNPEASLECKAQ